MSAPVVVTGLGVLAPNGVGVDDYWTSTLDGKSGIGPIDGFGEHYPLRLAGTVPGFDPLNRVPARLIPQTDHMTHLALVGADEAFADAGLDPAALPEYEMAVVTANSSGGTVYGQRELEKLWQRGPLFVGAYMSVAWFYAATTGQLSIRHGMRGPCGVIAGEQAGGLDAIAQAARLVRRGARLAVTGGTDAGLSPAGVTAQLATRLLSTVEDPTRAYLPFDVEACGHVPGEGGAIITLERADQAAARGIDRPYGVIAGSASTFDPAPGSPRPPALGRAIELALQDARLRPDQIDVVLADAAGRPGADAAEAAAITEVFGPRGVPVTAPKTMTGRLYAGGAPLDVVAALLALRDQIIPPTVNVTELAPECELDLVTDRPRERPLSTALVLARGYGGFNAAMVVTGPGSAHDDRRGA